MSNSISTIAQIPKGIKNKTVFKREQVEKVFSLHKQKFSYNDIARTLNLTPQRIGQIIRDYKKYYLKEDDHVSKR